MKKNYTSPDKGFICGIFDSISSRYDLLNHILSFGMADRWRRKSCEIVLDERGTGPKEPGSVPKTILDLGCGTGKFLECFLRSRPWSYVVGLDFSSAMLKKARETVRGNVLWLEEDFDKPPFLEASFDLIISGFTLRSVQNLPEFFQQIHRILVPGGKAAFLDLTRPQNFLVRLFFFPYLKFILPLLGWLISGNRKAYDFLSGSVRNFLPPEKTIELMKSAGFKDCCSKSFSFGVATFIIGEK